MPDFSRARTPTAYTKSALSMQCKQQALDCLQRLVDLEDKRVLNKTRLHNTTIQKYLLFSQLLRLLDTKLQIDPSGSNKLIFLQICQLFTHFFTVEFLCLPSFIFRKWHQKLLYIKCTPENAEVVFYSGHLHCNRQFLFEKRRDAVEGLKLQLMIQQQLNEREVIIDLELADLEVITRGYLARKKTRELRDEENTALGLNTKGLLLALGRVKPAPKETKVDLPTDMCELKTNLADILEYLKSNYFVVEKDDDEEEQMKPSNAFSEHTESIFETLVSVGLAVAPEVDLLSLVPVKVIVRSTSKSSHTTIFDLRSYLLAAVAIAHALSAFGSTTFKRNNLLFVGRPKSGRSSWSEALAHFLRATLVRVDKKSFVRKPISRQKICQKILQFIREDAYAVVEFNNLEIFKTTSRSRKTVTKKTIRSLLTSLTANPFVQVIGISTTDDLDPVVLKMFNSLIYFNQLDNFERFDMITSTLAQRLTGGTLPDPPTRTVRTEKMTKNMNCGEIIEKVDATFVQK
uniref:ATPase_AAA_core domain-containing protein n=1 Tax=Steinernema glaseri TaxID=37863 RepID=A0A1I7YTN8_9BILA